MLKKTICSKKIRPYLFLILLSLVTYLPNIQSWGYYRDDWHMLWVANSAGPAGVLRLFSTDRPFMGLIYGWEWLVLGNSPLAWNLFAFTLRVMGILIFYDLARMVFTGKKLFALTIALMFAIYPGYWQLPNGNTFQNHHMGLLLALISLNFSIRALDTKNQRWRVISVLLSVLSQSTYLMIYEYMIGFEAARLFLFFYYCRPKPLLQDKKTGISSLILYYLPYLIVSTLFLIWRLFIFKSARLTTDVSHIASIYLDTPLKTMIEMSAVLIQDFIDAVFLSWAVPFSLFNSKVTASSFYQGLALGVLCAGLFFLWIRWQNTEKDETLEDNKTWRDLYLLSGAMVLAGLFPVIFGNRQIEFGNTFDRYTFHVIPGAVIFLVVIIWQVFRSNAKRLIIISLLITTSVMVHYQNGLVFQKNWEYQRQLWWQLSWRAPDIKTGTTLLALLPESYRLAEHYEIWAPANLIYHPQGDPAVMGEVINHDTLPDILTGASYGRTFRRLPLVIDLKNSLVLSLPLGSSCLHLQDGANLELSSAEDPLVRVIAAKSNLDLVDHAAEPHRPPETIFGKEPDHGWCYFYQKASLARQQGDWKTVAALDAEAQALGLSPADPAEWMPFYEAYARLGDVPAVTAIAEKLRTEPDFLGPYCQSLNIEAFDDNYHQYLRNLCP